jgi:hypothetical protein
MTFENKNKFADTPANHEHISNVGNLTLNDIMQMDNDGLIDDSDLIDNLWAYLCDNLVIREKMNYNWKIDEE